MPLLARIASSVCDAGTVVNTSVTSSQSNRFSTRGAILATRTNPSPGSSLRLPIVVRSGRHLRVSFTAVLRLDFDSPRRAQYTSGSRPGLSGSGTAAQSRSAVAPLA